EIAKRIADLPGLVRLRLSSIDPSEVTDELIELVAEHPVLCRHFHLPLQSGSDAVLKRMRRKYSRREYLTVVEKVRSRIPEVAITTDVMVGFPGETAVDFQDTRDLVERASFSKMHVFKYSRRAGTAAARFPEQIPAEVKEERSKCLIKIGEEAAEAFHQSLVGQEVRVLVEQVEAGECVGHTDNYVRVRFPADAEDLVDTFVTVSVIAADSEEVRAQLIRQEGAEMVE
ncbi:MAG: radical SAM protein, partial [Limnochordia bacterium]